MQRLLLASGRGRLLYEAVARALGAYLVRGMLASAYVRGSVAARDVVPGLSDVDLLVVVDGDPAAARGGGNACDERSRRSAIYARVAVYERETVRERTAATALTHGLDEKDGTPRGPLLRAAARPRRMSRCTIAPACGASGATGGGSMAPNAAPFPAR